MDTLGKYLVLLLLFRFVFLFGGMGRREGANCIQIRSQRRGEEEEENCMRLGLAFLRSDGKVFLLVLELRMDLILALLVLSLRGYL